LSQSDAYFCCVTDIGRTADAVQFARLSAINAGVTDLPGRRAGFFFYAWMITFVTGFCLWLLTHRSRQEMRTRDGFLVVTLFWTVLSIFGALPFLFSPDASLSVTDAVFESFSGLTTTGATVMVGLDFLPESILFIASNCSGLAAWVSSHWL